jgi:hypothetical protein
MVPRFTRVNADWDYFSHARMITNAKMYQESKIVIDSNLGLKPVQYMSTGPLSFHSDYRH